MFESPFEKEPMTVNEIGTKFWLNEHLMEYAKKKKLKKITCFYVETKDGERTILLCQDNKPIYENQSSEAVAVFIDCWKVIQ